MSAFLRSRVVAAAAGAAGALFLAGGSYAIASGGGTIRACVHQHTGVLYEGRCRHPLRWSVAGPEGPAGPTGPQGLPGTAVGWIPTSGEAWDAGTSYAPLGGATTEPTEANGEMTVPVSSSLSQLRVHMSLPPGGGGSFTYTVDVDGSPTRLSCTIVDPTQDCQDLTDSVSLTAGARVDISVAPSNSPSNQPVEFWASLESQ